MAGIGILYKNGYGVDQDLNEAMRWFLEAKAHGRDVGEYVDEVIAMRRAER